VRQMADTSRDLDEVTQAPGRNLNDKNQHPTVLLGTSRRRTASGALSPAGPISAPQQVSQGLHHNLSTNLGNRLGQRNVLRANLDAVLCVAAFLDSAIAHQRSQPLALERLPRGMGIEKPHL